MKAADAHAAKNELAAIISTFLEEHGDVLGPVECLTHGDDLGDCDLDCEHAPTGDVFARSVEGWYLVVGYGLDETDHRHYLLDIKPPRQSRIYTTGLATYAAEL